MIRIKRFLPSLRAFIIRALPGAGHFTQGRRAVGLIILCAFLFTPLLAIVRFETFANSLRSFFLTAWLLLVDFGARKVFFQTDAIEYWVASWFAIGAPIVIWRIARWRYRRMTHGPDETERSGWSLAWRRFMQHKAAVVGLTVVVGIYGMAFLCPFLAPMDPNAFEDGTVTQYRPPFTRITTLLLKRDRVEGLDPFAGITPSPNADLIRSLKQINQDLIESGFRRVMFVDAYHIEAAEVVLTTGQNFRTLPLSEFASHEPEIFASSKLFILGTDGYGRDILSRVIYGSRISLSLGLIAVLLSVTLGTLVGLFAGYFGRAADSVLMRLVDIMLAFPTLFLILVVIALLEQASFPRIFLIVIVLGLTSWMGIARLVRGEVLSIKERDFIVAARAIGLNPIRILFRHVLPNVLTPIIVNATIRIGGIILVEAALSFLNLGVQSPTASWGNIIYEGKDYLSKAWWISTFPGFAIVLTVICFNLIGDGLRDAFDPMLTDERQ
jgi:peptide/nickel transport system permease protein